MSKLLTDSGYQTVVWEVMVSYGKKRHTDCSSQWLTCDQKSKYYIHYKQLHFGSSFHSFRRQWKPSTLQWLTHTYPAPHARWPAHETAPCAASSSPHAAGKQKKNQFIISQCNMLHITQYAKKCCHRAGQCQVKSNVMMNNSEIPSADMNYALGHRTGWVRVLVQF